jgi:hypothetical protein
VCSSSCKNKKSKTRGEERQRNGRGTTEERERKGRKEEGERKEGARRAEGKRKEARTRSCQVLPNTHVSEKEKWSGVERGKQSRGDPSSPNEGYQCARLRASNGSPASEPPAEPQEKATERGCGPTERAVTASLEGDSSMYNDMAGIAELL